MESPVDRFIEEQVDQHLDLLIRTPSLLLDLDSKRYGKV